MEEFNFVIARPWVEGKPQLSSYAYGREVFFGSMSAAISMCDFINGRCEEENRGKYKIHKIDSNPTN